MQIFTDKMFTSNVCIINIFGTTTLLGSWPPWNLHIVQIYTTPLYDKTVDADFSLLYMHFKQLTHSEFVLSTDTTQHTDNSLNCYALKQTNRVVLLIRISSECEIKDIFHYCRFLLLQLYCQNFWYQCRSHLQVEETIRF